MVKSVYLFKNGMIMTFGEDDKQIPKLQGPNTLELRKAIKKESNHKTVWVGFTGKEINLELLYR